MKMKRNLTIILTAFFLALTVMTLVDTVESVSAASTFKVRTSMPNLTEKGSEFYYTNQNLYYAAGRLAPDFKRYAGIMDDGKTAGYVWGNCTWYAYSRASEILDKPLNTNFRWAAGKWWDTNQNGRYYPSGQTPKVGAIACYKTHVAIVEKVVSGQIYVSESGWQTKTSGPRSTDEFFFHYGKPWSSNGTPKGYIYITDKTSITEKNIPVDYKVQVSVSDLRMREGPGTGYLNMGYIGKGIHRLKATTADGLWGQLKSNGYWVLLEYTTRVKEQTKSSDNRLKGLSVKDYSISPAFKATGTNYALTVPSNISSVTINATKADSKSTVSGTGKASLVTGNNVKKITVKAEDGKNKVYRIKITRTKEISVKVTISDLNMRTGPGASYKAKGKIKKGAHAITLTKNGWGKLKANGYWINLSYTKPMNKGVGYLVKVSISDLNMRTGPSSSYASKGTIKKGTYAIVKTKDGWGKLKTNGYWIKLSYTTKVK